MSIPIIRSTTRTISVDGHGRNDLAVGVEVVCTDVNTNNAGHAYHWSFLDRPVGSSAGITDATAATCRFTPDVTGSYFIQCTVDGGSHSREVLSAPLPRTGARIPAFNEGLEYDGEGNSKGWHEALTDFMRGADAGGGGSDASVANWDVTKVRYFFLDGDSGNDSSTGYIDAPGGTTFTQEQTGPVAVKTTDRLASLIPNVGAGRSFAVLVKPRAPTIHEAVAAAGTIMVTAQVSLYVDNDYWVIPTGNPDGSTIAVEIKRTNDFVPTPGRYTLDTSDLVDDENDSTVATRLRSIIESNTTLIYSGMNPSHYQRYLYLTWPIAGSAANTHKIEAHIGTSEQYVEGFGSGAPVRCDSTVYDAAIEGDQSGVIDRSMLSGYRKILTRASDLTNTEEDKVRCGGIPAIFGPNADRSFTVLEVTAVDPALWPGSCVTVRLTGDVPGSASEMRRYRIRVEDPANPGVTTSVGMGRWADGIEHAVIFTSGDVQPGFKLWMEIPGGELWNFHDAPDAELPPVFAGFYVNDWFSPGTKSHMTAEYSFIWVSYAFSGEQYATSTPVGGFRVGSSYMSETPQYWAYSSGYVGTGYGGRFGDAYFNQAQTKYNIFMEFESCLLEYALLLTRELRIINSAIGYTSLGYEGNMHPQSSELWAENIDILSGDRSLEIASQLNLVGRIQHVTYLNPQAGVTAHLRSGHLFIHDLHDPLGLKNGNVSAVNAYNSFKFYSDGSSYCVEFGSLNSVVGTGIIIVDDTTGGTACPSWQSIRDTGLGIEGGVTIKPGPQPDAYPVRACPRCVMMVPSSGGPYVIPSHIVVRFDPAHLGMVIYAAEGAQSGGDIVGVTLSDIAPPVPANRILVATSGIVPIVVETAGTAPQVGEKAYLASFGMCNKTPFNAESISLGPVTPFGGETSAETTLVYVDFSAASLRGVTVINENKLLFTDITTANASTQMHGLMPKLSGESFKYIGGDGKEHPLTTSGSAHSFGGGYVNDSVTPLVTETWMLDVSPYPPTQVWYFAATGYGAADLIVQLYDLTSNSVACTLTIPASAGPATAHAVCTMFYGAAHYYEVRFHSSIEGVPVYLGAANLYY